MSRFTVTFRDEETLVINDIILFEQDQIKEIRGIAADFLQSQLRREEKHGKDLSYITEKQKQTVIHYKDQIISGIPAAKLLDDEIIQVSLYSSERSLKRIRSNDRDTIIGLINRVKNTDTVTKAQFKGYPSLSYTTLEKENPEGMKLPISFVWGKKGNHVIKMITVAPRNVEGEAMETSITETNPETAAMLEEIKKRLNGD
ncbi:hypothetical protein [Salibacterium qingdaonense]|uniref:Uncharacterized protein n=1 Tax=Salibacterium qingdaonense TaxID=266892 RepID=A0A1I4NKH9_9BACI|nr:hypothetical protein [Salibacterium qingdaonense]SFM15807.1 hypothetical protein SAMN04488054_11859 [Salibacterium qingdaonense]